MNYLYSVYTESFGPISIKADEYEVIDNILLNFYCNGINVATFTLGSVVGVVLD